jgi:phenylacetate-coenzyme A ligase PaaK-like adenylate-forming protein
LLDCNPEEVSTIDQIPFLPIEFFKSHRVITGNEEISRVFESSGTTGMLTSKHYLTDERLYLESLESGFRHFFGDPAGYCFLALLPAYLERSGSSLVYMMNHLIGLSDHPLSGFYLRNLSELADNLRKLEAEQHPTILIGVTFALLDLAEQFAIPLKTTKIIETGGMKGRREEMTREEVHAALTTAFGVPAVGSEYGMTELLSQAWSTGNGIFRTPPWMKILIRDPYNPFRHLPAGKSGGIDVIDLANRNSCSFIQTQDLGRLLPDGSFEVLGRFDNAVLRGCNLMVQ